MKNRMMVVVLATMLAAEAPAGTGIAKYAGEFLAIGVGGRALALGGASVALSGDVTSGFWNPAGLARIDYPQMILMHNEQFGSLVNHDYGAVAIPFGTSASLGLSVIRLGVDDIPDTRDAGVDINGNLTYDPNQFSRVDPNRVKYFNAADWAVFLTYAKRESANLSYGANVKLIRRSLGSDGAWGIGFDIGAQYSPMEDLMLGVNLQDITTTLVAWNTGTNELISPTAKIGSVYYVHALGGRFAPTIDADVRFENRRTASMAHIGRMSFDFHTGLEYLFKNIVALRVGYSDVKQLTFGGGVQFSKIAIDYSFAKFDGQYQLGNSHRISVMFTLESDKYRRNAE